MGHAGDWEGAPPPFPGVIGPRSFGHPRRRRLKNRWETTTHGGHAPVLAARRHRLRPARPRPPRRAGRFAYRGRAEGVVHRGERITARGRLRPPPPPPAGGGA